ncbi:MAG: HlyD family efflux transporter periplasmic adaptor subunit [Candidatus Roizmanbacteria bacterium]
MLHKLRTLPRIVYVVAVVALIGVIWYWRTYGSSSSSTVTYQTAVVDKGSVISTVTASGSVSINSVSVSSPATGVVTEVYVKNGEIVKAGDNLFAVQSTATAADKASAYASYLSAVNSLASAKSSKQSLDSTMWSSQKTVLDAQNAVDFKNNNTTNPSTKTGYTDLEKQSIESTLVQAQKSFAAAEQKYKDADMAVNSSQAQLSAAWLAYQATQNAIAVAPIGGTVVNLNSDVGSTVTASGSASNSTATASTVLTLADLASVQTKVVVSEVDIPKVKAGQKATITVNAFSGKTFAGRVSRVDTIGTTTSGVVTYNAIIQFTAVPEGVVPGMNASAVIQTQRKDDALKVPLAAVKTSGTEQTVQVLTQSTQTTTQTDPAVTAAPIQTGTPTTVTVTTGISSDTEIEILSGLKVGDTVVTRTISAKTATTSTTSASPFGSIGGARGIGGGGRPN